MEPSGSAGYCSLKTQFLLPNGEKYINAADLSSILVYFEWGENTQTPFAKILWRPE